MNLWDLEGLTHLSQNEEQIDNNDKTVCQCQNEQNRICITTAVSIAHKKKHNQKSLQSFEPFSLGSWEENTMFYPEMIVFKVLLKIATKYCDAKASASTSAPSPPPVSLLFTKSLASPPPPPPPLIDHRRSPITSSLTASSSSSTGDRTGPDRTEPGHGGQREGAGG